MYFTNFCNAFPVRRPVESTLLPLTYLLTYLLTKHYTCIIFRAVFSYFKLESVVGEHPISRTKKVSCYRQKHGITHATNIKRPTANCFFITSARGHCDRSCLLVRSSVGYAHCDFSKSKSLARTFNTYA